MAVAAVERDTREELIKVFRSFDANGDGTISRQQLVRVLEFIDGQQFLDRMDLENLLGQFGVSTSCDGLIDYVKLCTWIANDSDAGIMCVAASSSQLSDMAAGANVKPAASAKVCKPLRIVLTGGPCGGKSSALPKLRAAVEERGYTAYTLQEVPTILISGGCTFPRDQPDRILEYEAKLLKLQLEMENAFLQLAGTNRCALICDRGALDIGAYISDDMWKQVLDMTEVSQQDLVDRYDLVLFFRTAADGAESFYKGGKCTDDNGVPVLRTRDPARARDMDSKSQAAYTIHPNVHVLDNTLLFDDKIAAAVEKVNDALAAHDAVPATVLATVPATRVLRKNESRRDSNAAHW